MDKRIKKGSAVLIAWTLIAVLGVAPAGAAFPSYASVTVTTEAGQKRAS